jgi:hypothetical protein
MLITTPATPANQNEAPAEELLRRFIIAGELSDPALPPQHEARLAEDRPRARSSAPRLAE